jgi:hypothetical protein
MAYWLRKPTKEIDLHKLIFIYPNILQKNVEEKKKYKVA